MDIKRTMKTGVLGAVLASGSIMAVPSIASATSRHFIPNQQKLEQQLADRASQLTRLATDVTGSKSLTADHASLLSGRISTASANINALVTKVPNDTTQAQLNTDRRSMLAQNRVFAVLTPQVFITIEADSTAAQVSTFQGDEPALQASVNGLVGQHGYQNALNHYVAFVKSVNNAAGAVNSVLTTVLAQVPADYPGDTHVFTNANHQMLNAGVALAHANYDASVIGLASGGYTGS